MCCISACQPVEPATSSLPRIPSTKTFSFPKRLLAFFHAGREIIFSIASQSIFGPNAGQATYLRVFLQLPSRCGGGLWCLIYLSIFPIFPQRKSGRGKEGRHPREVGARKTVDQFILCGKYRGAIMTSGRQIDKQLVQFKTTHCCFTKTARRAAS